MNIQRFKQIIARREWAGNISNEEWDEEIQKCWDEEVAVLIEDIDSSINYLDNQCTPDEFANVSEIIDDLTDQINSDVFIKCFERLCKKYPETAKKYNIPGITQELKEGFESRQASAAATPSVS